MGPKTKETYIFIHTESGSTTGLWLAMFKSNLPVSVALSHLEIKIICFNISLDLNEATNNSMTINITFLLLMGLALKRLHL